MKSPGPFIMGWNIQFLGTLPCQKITSESLSRKLDKIVRLNFAPEFVLLSVSLKGVFVASEDDPQNPFLEHSIRNVCCVFAKANTRQIIYVTKKICDDGKSKKECHIFRTETSQQVEEIESVLSSAFQRLVFVDNSLTAVPSNSGSRCSDINSETTISSNRSNSLPRMRPKSSADQNNFPSSPEVVTSTPAKKRSTISAAVLFQKVFGTPKSTKAMPQQEKRRKRPVSVILGQAINNVSAQTDNTLTPKKVSTRPQQFGTPAIMLCDGAVDRKPSQIPVNKEPALEFDEKLGEFVFPIGEFMDDQLQRLAYFCKNQNREEVYPVLQQMPEGAFILRYSASRRKCLALTVRIPENENGSKIAHFLIIRNEHGFRIKGAERYFKSLPMLITHYTILPELLPCRLIFVEWDKTLLKGKPQQNTLICLDNCAKDYQTMNIIELNQSPRRKLARKSIQLCQI